jgi:hypothetical protein
MTAAPHPKKTSVNVPINICSWLFHPLSPVSFLFTQILLPPERVNISAFNACLQVTREVWKATVIQVAIRLAEWAYPKKVMHVLLFDDDRFGSNAAQLFSFYVYLCPLYSVSDRLGYGAEKARCAKRRQTHHNMIGTNRKTASR